MMSTIVLVDIHNIVYFLVLLNTNGQKCNMSVDKGKCFSGISNFRFLEILEQLFAFIVEVTINYTLNLYFSNTVNV